MFPECLVPLLCRDYPWRPFASAESELEEWAGLSWPVLTSTRCPRVTWPWPAAGSGTRPRLCGVQQSGLRSHVSAPGLGQQWPVLHAGPRPGRPLCSVLRAELAWLTRQDLNPVSPRRRPGDPAVTSHSPQQTVSALVLAALRLWLP